MKRVVLVMLLVGVSGRAMAMSAEVAKSANTENSQSTWGKVKSFFGFGSETSEPSTTAEGAKAKQEQLTQTRAQQYQQSQPATISEAAEYEEQAALKRQQEKAPNVTGLGKQQTNAEAQLQNANDMATEFRARAGGGKKVDPSTKKKTADIFNGQLKQATTDVSSGKLAASDAAQQVDSAFVNAFKKFGTDVVDFFSKVIDGITGLPKEVKTWLLSINDKKIDELQTTAAKQQEVFETTQQSEPTKVRGGSTDGGTLSGLEKSTAQTAELSAEMRQKAGEVADIYEEIDYRLGFEQVITNPGNALDAMGKVLRIVPLKKGK